MYADFSHDQVTAFLQDLTDQPKSLEIESVAETFSEDMILAEMELARFKTAAAKDEVYETRAEVLMRLNRVHPADLQ